MKMKQEKRIRNLMAASLFSIFSGTVLASENLDFPTEASKEDVVSIVCPVIGEEEISPFHFILDPQRLLYETGAMRYGGGVVEEGATLLFHNLEGEYDFSKSSDFLTVTNYSTVPVNVTISAQIKGLEGIELAEEDDFSNEKNCSLYLAVFDSAGNLQPLPNEEEIFITVELQPAPKNAYTYGLDQGTPNYQHVSSGNMKEFDFDTYSFGLTGACNPNADWADVDVHPVVTITWHAEPVLSGEKTAWAKEADDMQDKGVAVSEEVQTEE